MKEILDSDATISNKDNRERDLLIAFVGIKHDYYLEKWKDKEKLFSKLNFAAFFLPSSGLYIEKCISK